MNVKIPGGGSYGRSALREVRNPILALPSFNKINNLPEKDKEVIGDILRELSAEAAQKADKSWASNKAPMAAYWKACSVYAKHMARVINPRKGTVMFDAIASGKVKGSQHDQD